MFTESNCENENHEKKLFLRTCYKFYIQNNLKLRCDRRFTHAFTACSCVFKVITLVWSNQRNFFENATTCSKRMRTTLVATQFNFFEEMLLRRSKSCLSFLNSRFPWSRILYWRLAANSLFQFLGNKSVREVLGQHFYTRQRCKSFLYRILKKRKKKFQTLFFLLWSNKTHHKQSYLERTNTFSSSKAQMFVQECLIWAQFSVNCVWKS